MIHMIWYESYNMNHIKWAVGHRTVIEVNSSIKTLFVQFADRSLSRSYSFRAGYLEVLVAWEYPNLYQESRQRFYRLGDHQCKCSPDILKLFLLRDMVTTNQNMNKTLKRDFKMILEEYGSPPMRRAFSGSQSAIELKALFWKPA